MCWVARQDNGVPYARHPTACYLWQPASRFVYDAADYSNKLLQACGMHAGGTCLATADVRVVAVLGIVVFVWRIVREMRCTPARHAQPVTDAYAGALDANHGGEMGRSRRS